jgi:hypothetical protein
MIDTVFLQVFGKRDCKSVPLFSRKGFFIESQTRGFLKSFIV